MLFNQDQPQVARVYIFYSRGQRSDCALPAGSTVPFGTDPGQQERSRLVGVCPRTRENSVRRTLQPVQVLQTLWSSIPLQTHTTLPRGQTPASRNEGGSSGSVPEPERTQCGARCNRYRYCKRCGPQYRYKHTQHYRGDRPRPARTKAARRGLSLNRRELSTGYAAPGAGATNVVVLNTTTNIHDTTAGTDPGQLE